MSPAASPDGTAPRGASSGALLGRYELLFRIAAGGMAEVHAGRVRGEAGFEKLVAIKRMLPHLAEDDHFVDMFLDEARVASNVTSPHVVQTLDLGRAADGSLFLVLELVVGASLWTLMRAAARRKEQIPLPIALEILAQAAQGLDDAHEAVTPTGLHLRIVHRDVSPQNLLVGADGRTRVTDFGIARALLRRTSTSTGELKGKAPYFSPEQARGKEVDRRSDVFAIGIVAWEAVTGQRLFGGSDTLQTLQRVVDEHIEDPRERRPDLPVTAANAILKALRRDVDNRWQTAADFSAELREAARELGPAVTAREVGRWVADVAGEPLQRMRERIDAAFASPLEAAPSAAIDVAIELEDDGPTHVADKAKQVESGIVSIARTSPELTAAPVPTALLPVVAETRAPAPVSAVSTIEAEMPALRPRWPARAAVAAGVIALVGVIFWLGRMTNASDHAGADPEPATTAIVTAPSATPIVEPAPPPTVAAPIATAIAADGQRAAARSTAPTKARPSTTTTPTTTAPAATVEAAPVRAAPTPTVDPPAAHPAPARSSPLLGDDAFQRDLTHLH
jgi:eukaryotic-like serine/threonine-protein kinase